MNNFNYKLRIQIGNLEINPKEKYNLFHDVIQN